MATTGKRRKYVILIATVAVAALAVAGLSRLSGREKAASGSDAATFTVSRGDLVMSVTESGTIKARNAVEVESGVEGDATIISLVPEGSTITQQDVADGKILVELDASELRDDINQQKITFNSAEADYTEAKESLTIQKNQNDSDVQQGLLNVKFARMDLQKYLGADVADVLIEQYKTTGKVPTLTTLIADPNALGGASQQKLREMRSDIDLAKEEYDRASDDLVWTEKLYKKDYVSKSELESDELKVTRLKVNWERSQTSQDLFLKYDFPKEVEKLFSDYLEAERELERIYARTRSKLSQAEARLGSMQARYELNKERLERIQSQIDACVMRATEPGLVIYASNSGRRWSRSRTNIEVGEEVYERQLIMTITNAEEMDVDVKVHETNVDKVQKGQPVRIVIDAQPDKVFDGSVQKIAPLPEPTSFWGGNPDLKVYTTDVSLEGADPSIRPGMNAQVEIVIAELMDVLVIPIQCVANRGGQKVCYLSSSGEPEERVIKTGAFNDRFVEVLEGLEEGQQVLLNPPRVTLSRSEEAALKRSNGRKKGSGPGAGEKKPADTGKPASGGMSEQFKKMDKNGDGKISISEEMPEQMRPHVKSLDTNQDGFLDQQEMNAAAKKMAPPAGGKPGQKSSKPQGPRP